MERAESAEVYGCVRDTDQAKLVFNLAARTAPLWPVLSERLQVIEHPARIVDEKADSVYAVIHELGVIFAEGPARAARRPRCPGGRWEPAKESAQA